MHIRIFVGVTIIESSDMSTRCRRYLHFSGNPESVQMWLLEQMRKPGYSGYRIAKVVIFHMCKVTNLFNENP
jgi:hypothetical protein